MKFLHFKKKDSILSAAHKLKGTGVAISNDYPANVRQARRNLIAFSKTLPATSKLRFDRLYADDKCYRYDASTSSVQEINRRGA